jgi:hypothetical protein
VQFWGLLRVLVTMGWSDGSKNARGGRGRQRAKTKEEQRIFDLNFGLRPKFFLAPEDCQGGTSKQIKNWS